MKRHLRAMVFTAAAVIVYNVGYVVGGVQTARRLKSDKS